MKLKLMVPCSSCEVFSFKQSTDWLRVCVVLLDLLPRLATCWETDE